MKRPNLLHKTGVMLAVLFCMIPITAASAVDRPNVLFIAVDDMRDWIGCLETYPGVKTPNIDRLARRGTLFTNAHCAASVCNPSRTAVMTGLRPSTSGIYDNNRWWRPNLPDIASLPEHFRANGYFAAGGGKIFHHPPGFNPPDQWNQFFDQVFDDPWHRAAPGSARQVRSPHFPSGFPLNGLNRVTDVPGPVNPMEFDWGPLDKSDSEMGDGQMVTWATRLLERISQQTKRPFFLAAGTFRPHLPWYAPRAYFDQYPIEGITLPPVKDNDLDDVPTTGRKFGTARARDIALVKHAGKWREAIQAYLASISYADALVGRLLNALHATGQTDNTIIVLWSDHGWHLGEKGHWHKMTLWEVATRVPLIIVAPGITRPGSRCARPVSLVDLYPTLVDLCNVAPNERLDGTSLVPLLKDPDASWHRPALVTYKRGNHALRDQRWRYIRYADGGEELYDHENDPNEWTNLADDPAYSNVKARLSRWLPETDAPNAASKSAFEFDISRYDWTRKSVK